jgi:hypothetical protein
LWSTPIVVRRGTARNDWLTSACSSTRIGRVPSMLQITAEPGAFSGRSSKNSSDGFATSSSPLSFISKTPISLVEPKRFLDRAENSKIMAAVAFEIEHGVDHVLEHARPGERAVLGHVADQNVLRPVFFASVMIAPEHSRTCPMLPGAEGSAEEKIVWIESITRTCGRIFLICSRILSSAVSLRMKSLGASMPRRSARILIWRGDSSPGDVEAGEAGSAERGEGLNEQRRFADAGIAADERHRSGHEPPPRRVEFADAREHAVLFVGRYRRDRGGVFVAEAGLRRAD